jgi:hypothetical protein
LITSGSIKTTSEQINRPSVVENVVHGANGGVEIPA